MELVVDWNSVCLVCLQEGEMRSIYDKDDNMTICDKIVRCTNVQIHKGMNLPEQICSCCYEDLKIAYKFTTNFASSNVILKSFVVSTNIVDVSTENGQKYQFKSPSGLNIRRIKVAPRFEIKTEEPIKTESVVTNSVHNSSNNDGDEDYRDTDNFPSSSNEILEPTAYADVDDDNVRDDELNEFVEEHEQEREMEIKLEKNEPKKTERPRRKNYEQFNKTIEKLLSEAEDDDDRSEVITEKPTTRKSTKSSIATETKIKRPKQQQQKQTNVIRTGKRGRPRTRIMKPSKDIIEEEITPDNVSSLVPKLTTVICNVRKKSNESKPLKICEVCGNSYKYQHALESHMRRHRNEKPFSCEFCDRAFVANVELRRHMRVHTGQKPYHCRYCERSFSDFGSRIKHERTHTGERPYSCSTCGKAFAYAHVLSVHLLTHTGEKRFKCEICGKGLTKKTYLVSHMRHHLQNNKKPAPREDTSAPGGIEIFIEKIEDNYDIHDEMEDKIEYIEEEEENE